MKNDSDGQGHYHGLATRQLGMTKSISQSYDQLNCLRHTAIMYRLSYDENVSTLELTCNARTLQATLDKHYASRLTTLIVVNSRQTSNCSCASLVSAD